MSPAPKGSYSFLDFDLRIVPLTPAGGSESEGEWAYEASVVSPSTSEAVASHRFDLGSIQNELRELVAQVRGPGRYRPDRSNLQ